MSSPGVGAHTHSFGMCRGQDEHRSSALSNVFMALLDSHSAEAKTRPQWTDFCERYIQHGHTATDCRETLLCTTCNEAHATRDCTRSEENAITIYADEPIKSDDGINRDALASFSGYDNSGKHVKIRRAARAARQPPPLASTASKNAFKALSRKIREDPNEYEPEDSGGIPVVGQVAPSTEPEPEVTDGIPVVEQVAPPTEPKSATLDANEVAVEVG
ncbi:hypothetical protein BKA56DRAFT_213116 [Ilyonectria sp. MPI-CAGE-AT-0026]|nr:hypothetical protein BKA56DRAFT_213116 [Ilyonectria sp. MPI-CAGE-AT-0026]